MSFPEVVRNTGNIFVEGALIETAAKFGDEEWLRDQFEQMREHYERRLGDVNDESNAQDVGFFLLSHALHVLGYTHSHNENLPNNAGRIDYTLFDSADEFHFAYQTLDGDGEITARVASLQNSHSWAKAGVMMRESLTGNSAHAMMLLTPSSKIW